MTGVFRAVLEMSITGTWVILAVLLVRMLLRPFPKRYSYALWAAVGFRLCCPVSFPSLFSLFRLPNVQTGAMVTQNRIPQVQPMVMGTSQNGGPPVVVSSVPASAASGQSWLEFLAAVWLAGMAALLLYSILRDVCLRLRLRTATRLRDNIYQSEQVGSPFILGVIRPRIYLPCGLDAQQEAYVLAHERCHLKRLDHMLKLAAYLILTVHWFNPLCYVAFWLFGRDMEMACDEAVLGNNADRCDYSAALVSMATERKMPSHSPLAFGETAVKGRVKNILRWRKPRAWAAALGVLLCAAMILACAADPVENAQLKEGSYIIANGQTGEDYPVSDLVQIQNGKLILSNEIYDLSDKEWQAPPFEALQWEGMLTHLEGAAPETLENCEYMELFVLSNETLEIFDREVDRGRAIARLYEITQDMGNTTCTIFLLRQENTLFVCHYYQNDPAYSGLHNTRFLSDRLVQSGGELDPTVQTFSQLDDLMAQVLAQPGKNVAAKAAANEELYGSIIWHKHLRYYLCHVMQTEGLDGEKGELAGILFEDLLRRRFEDPLIQRGNMTAAQYFENYMAYAEQYYKDVRLYYASSNASGPMLYYLQTYYGYGQ